jgi:hypothetical protein
MSSKYPITQKIKTIPPEKVSADRYTFIRPGEQEPNLGVPPENGHFLTSTTTGTRSWVPAYPSPSPGLDNQVLYNNNGAITGATGLYYDSGTGRLGLGVVAPTARLDIAETWNNSATVFTAIKTNITDTSSSASSLLVDVKVNNATKFKVSKTGVVTASSFVGDLVGNAATASALSADVLVTLTGEVTGSASFNGSTDLSIVTTPDIITFVKTLTLTTVWQDVGINSTALDSGTYIIQLFANDSASGGKNINEYYSGIISWYSGTTANPVTLPNDEILLHRAGGSSEEGIFLRNTRGNSPDYVKLQIYSTTNNSSAANYTFKFRKLI